MTTPQFDAEALINAHVEPKGSDVQHEAAIRLVQAAYALGAQQAVAQWQPTEAQLVAGLEDIDPLGGLVDWRPELAGPGVYTGMTREILLDGIRAMIAAGEVSNDH